MSNIKQEVENRRILEELQAQKRQLMLKTGGQTSSAVNLGNSESNRPISVTQKQALLMAANSSFGFFVPQDSAFGNVLLPVIPRFDPPKTS